MIPYAETCAAVGPFFAKQDVEVRTRWAKIFWSEIYNGTISGMQLDGTKFHQLKPIRACRPTPYGEEEYTPSDRLSGDQHAVLRTWRVWMTSLVPMYGLHEDTIHSHLSGTAIFETAGGVKIALTSKYLWNGSVTTRQNRSRREQNYFAVISAGVRCR